MENIGIETTQNVTINYELASIGDRILATLLDYIFFFAYYLLACLVYYLFHLHSTALIIVMLIPILLYDLVCELIFQGQTFGKMIMKIKVVMLDGTQAGFSAYLLRWMFRIIDTKLFLGGLALITIVVNGKGQRIGDIAAGTTVIKLKQKVTIHDTILNRVKPEYSLVFSEVARLTDTDISIIKDVMLVSMRTNNTEAIEKLAGKTKAAMGITTNLPHIQFLATVVQDYSFYNFEK